MVRIVLLAAVLAVLPASGAGKYAGPKPAKPDTPYLLHGGKLVPTETADAKEEKKGKESVYTIAGAKSTARTPLAEPIFILDAQTIAPERMELYKAETKGGEREVTLTGKRQKDSAGPMHLNVFPLNGKLYRLEAGEVLEEGEYCLSSSGSNRVFCFAVY